MTEQFHLSEKESNLEWARLLSGQIMLPNLLFNPYNPQGGRREPSHVQGYTCGDTNKEINNCIQNYGEKRQICFISLKSGTRKHKTQRHLVYN